MAAREGPEKVDRKDDPDEGDGDVDGPDELGVFLAATEAEREGDGGGDDDELPAPEVQRGEKDAGEARLHEALGGVVDAGKQHVADEGEDDGVGVQRSQAAEGEARQVEVDAPEVELRGDEHADQHADRAPNDGGDQELSDDLVVVVD